MGEREWEIEGGRERGKTGESTETILKLIFKVYFWNLERMYFRGHQGVKNRILGNKSAVVGSV